jgi:hypothetical protein
MLQRVIDEALTNTIYWNLSIQTPQEFDEKELYGC